MNRLKDVVEVIQEIVNRIAEKSGFPHENRHYVIGEDFLLQDELDLFLDDLGAMEEDDDEDYHTSTRAGHQQNFSQFENLRVKMDEKTQAATGTSVKSSVK